MFLGPEVKGLHWQKIANPEIAVMICLIQPARRPQTALSLEAAGLAKAALLDLLVINPSARRRQ